jgi:hypothetical protein
MVFLLIQLSVCRRRQTKALGTITDFRVCFRNGENIERVFVEEKLRV